MGFIRSSVALQFFYGNSSFLSHHSHCAAYLSHLSRLFLFPHTSLANCLLPLQFCLLATPFCCWLRQDMLPALWRQNRTSSTKKETKHILNNNIQTPWRAFTCTARGRKLKTQAPLIPSSILFSFPDFVWAFSLTVSVPFFSLHEDTGWTRWLKNLRHSSCCLRRFQKSCRREEKCFRPLAERGWSGQTELVNAWG